VVNTARKAIYKSHTRTVVRECFKGDETSQWKRPKFDPSPHQNPLTDHYKNWPVFFKRLIDSFNVHFFHPLAGNSFVSLTTS